MRASANRWLGSAVLAAALVVGLSAMAERSAVLAPPIDDPLREALSGIDFVADKSLFDDLLGGQAAEDLIAIARDPDDELDPGLRLRAYHALALYPADTVVALLDAVDEHASVLVDSGIEILYAKAAMSSLAMVVHTASPTDKALARGQLGDALQHPVADLRAAAARALGKSGLVGATALLQDRLSVETTALVRDAIRRALLDLGGL